MARWASSRRAAIQKFWPRCSRGWLLTRRCATGWDFSIKDMPQNTSQLIESPRGFKTSINSWLDPLIDRFCSRTDSSTYDPYDIWKTAFGFQVKQFYNHHSLAGLPAAAALTLLDTFVNNRVRVGYRPQEYPIVRATAALCLLNRYVKGGPPK